MSDKKDKRKEKMAALGAEPGLPAVMEKPQTPAVVLTSDSFNRDDYEVKSAPPLVLPKHLTVGQGVSGTILNVKTNITGEKEMADAVCLHIRHSSGKEFLFPVTGVISKALDEKPETFIGREIVLIRREDGFAKKYKRAMFNFDVLVKKIQGG